jgi:hypothetical protein
MRQEKVVKTIAVALYQDEWDALRAALEMDCKMRGATTGFRLKRAGLIRWAIRVVCNSIVREGAIPWPLACDVREESSQECDERLGRVAANPGPESFESVLKRLGRLNGGGL